MSTASFEQPNQVVIQPTEIVPWNPWLGMIFIILVFFGAQVLSGVFVALAAASVRGSAFASALGDVQTQFLFVLLSEIFTVGAIVLFVRAYKQKLSLIGLRVPRWRDPVYGLLAVPVYYFLFFLALSAATRVFPSLNVSQKQEIGFDNVTGQTQLILTFISLVVLVPIAEELMFRGFMFTNLRKSMPIWVAGLITSLLFGAGHLMEGGASGPLYVGALQTFTLSVVLIYLRQKTRTLWPGIMLHASNNFVAFLYLFVIHTPGA